MEKEVIRNVLRSRPEEVLGGKILEVLEEVDEALLVRLPLSGALADTDSMQDLWNEIQRLSAGSPMEDLNRKIQSYEGLANRFESRWQKDPPRAIPPTAEDLEYLRLYYGEPANAEAGEPQEEDAAAELSS